MDFPSFMLPGSDPNTPNAFIQNPEQVLRQRALANSLMQSGMDSSPIRSPWQGFARTAQTLAAVLGNYKADEAQRLGQSDAAASFGNALGADPGNLSIPSTQGQTTPALQASDERNDAVADAQDGSRPNALAMALGGSSAPAPAPASGSSPLAAALGGSPYQAAIAKIESGGNYGATGPITSSGDRAYGKYQVMGANIPQWTQAALGRSMTPQQFLASPQAQDAVFNHQFGGYVSKYGPADAASMWLTGRTLANGGAAARDQNGTTGQSYADQFTRNLGAAPASNAIAGATGRAPTWEDVQSDAAQGDKAIASAEARGNGALPDGGTAYAPTTSPAAAGASPGGPQGAGAVSPPASAPSQADLGQLRTAMVSQQPGAPSMPPAAAQQAQPAMNGFHPDTQSLLNILSNPWATPAQQQIAQTLLSSQMPTPPEFKTIKDATGAEVPIWVNPRTGTVTPANVPGGGSSAGFGGPALAPLPSGGGAPATPTSAAAPGASPPAPSTLAGSVNLSEANGMTPQGAAYLDQMEAQGGAAAATARQARAIINGGEPMPEGKPGEAGLGAAVKDAVLKAAPGFNASLATARTDLVKSFGDKSSATSAGGQIIAANTGLHHLAALADSAEKINKTGFLPNGSPAVNWAANGLREMSIGHPALKEFELNKLALAEELGKMYKGGSPAEAEVRALVENLSPNMTPDEQKAAFAKVATLLQGKTVELQRQWQTAFGPKSTYPVIGEEGQNIIKRIGGGGETEVPGAAPVATVKTPGDVAKLAKGTRFIIPDGSGRIGTAP